MSASPLSDFRADDPSFLAPARLDDFDDPLFQLIIQTFDRRDDVLKRIFDRYLQPLLFSAQLELDDPVFHTAVADRHPHRYADEIGVLEFDAWVIFAIVQEHIEPAPCQFTIEFFRHALRLTFALGQ